MLEDSESKQLALIKSKYNPFVNTPAMWNLNFMQRSIWGKLQKIEDDGTLNIMISRNRIILANPDTVIAVGMV
jgi:hypothetical protein